MPRRSSGSTGTPATRILSEAGVPHVLRTYRHDPRSESYGLEAALELGVAPDRVFKTLLADIDGALVVAIVPVDTQVDLKLLAAAVGGKRAAMARGGPGRASHRICRRWDLPPRPAHGGADRTRRVGAGP